MNMLLFIVCSTSIFGQGSSLKFQPQKPKAGETITIIYNPAGSILKKVEKVVMIIHVYGKVVYYSNETQLKKRGNVWTGEFSVADTCAGVVICFTDGEHYDNNGSSFFPIRFYGKDGKFVKYASATLAEGYSNWFKFYQVDLSPAAALKLYEEEFALYPQQKREYLTRYYSAFNKVDKDRAAAFMKKETGNYEKTLTQSVEDLSFLANIYAAQKLEEKAQKTNALLVEKYPRSMQAERFKFREVYDMIDSTKKAELANKFKEQFPNSWYNQWLFPAPNSTLALIKAGKYKEAYEALRENPNASSEDYNYIAWSMYQKNIDLPLAKEVASKGVGLIEAEIKSSLADRPVYLSESQYKKMARSYGKEIMDTYGAILLKLGENEEALKYMKQAYEMYDKMDVGVNQRYAQALLANGKIEEAKSVEKFVLSEKRAAPKFSLLDLNGNKVSLEELKGKTVVLDFWATWCGPCKASFPGMQKAVDKFSNDPNIKFLFINTMENAHLDKQKNASDFIKQNNYTFQVLLDNDNKVVETYKIAAIPTKFIIDKEGNIRFKSDGYGGNADELVDELSAMIEMIK